MVLLEIDIENEFVNIAMRDYSCIAFKFKREGIKGGSDRLIFCPNGHSFFIEFKRPKGIISEHQKDFATMMEEFSKPVYFAYSLDQAIEFLKYELHYDKQPRQYK